MIPGRPIRRTFLALLAIGAWLAASNHCGLAAMAGGTVQNHACCQKAKPAKPNQPRAMECCEAFNVPVPEHAAAPAPQLCALKPAWPDAGNATAPEPRDRPTPACATGPPGSSFAEIVLQSSLLAHAPPVFVA